MYSSNVSTLRVFVLSYLATELCLEGLLSPEDLAAEVWHDFHEMSAKVEKCDGAEAVTARLQDMCIPQVEKMGCRDPSKCSSPRHLIAPTATTPEQQTLSGPDHTTPVGS